MGATIARRTRDGARIRIITVFAGDPGSKTPAADWDRACGFGTAGAAARARRDEDRRACSILGATPVWLPFADNQYATERLRERADVWAALEPELAGASLVLVPGWPLVHEDHAWLSALCSEYLGDEARLGFYIEQPYGQRVRTSPRSDIAWRRQRARVSELRVKGRACRAYRSQFRGRLHLERSLLLPELVRRDEHVGRRARS